MKIQSMEINCQEKKKKRNCQDYTSIHCRNCNLSSGSLSPQTVLLISGAGKFFVKGQLVNIIDFHMVSVAYSLLFF